jgi:MFS family permease
LVLRRLTAKRMRTGPLAFCSALGYPHFRYFWLGQIASVLGQNMEFVAQSWLVLELTGSPLMLGLTGLSRSIPAIGLNLVGGAIADRADRSTLLRLTQAAQACILATQGLLVVTGSVRVWHVLLCAFLLGVVRAFDQPSRQAILPSLVPQGELVNAVALAGSVWNLTRLVGPACAGVLVALYGMGPTYFVACAGFLIFFVLLLFIPGDKPLSASQPRGFLGDLLGGLTFIRTHEIFYMLIGMTFLGSIFGSSYQTMLPYFARHILDVGSPGLGLLQSCSGVGALAGAFLVATCARYRYKGRLVLAGAAAFGLLLVGFALSAWFPLSLVLIMCMSFANQTYMTTVNVALQARLPNEFRGRVMGIFGLTYTLTPLGGTFAGTMAEFTSVPWAVALSGLLLTVIVITCALKSPALRRLA